MKKHFAAFSMLALLATAGVSPGLLRALLRELSGLHRSLRERQSDLERKIAVSPGM